MTATAEKNGQDFRRKYQEADERWRKAAEERRQYRQEAEKHGYSVDDDDSHSFSAKELVLNFPDRRPYVIDGLLRRGEIMNIIAAPKVGKSWLIYSLLIAVAEGMRWLGFDATQTPVLLIDNELHKEELAYRLREVAYAMKLDLDKVDLTIESLRGQQTDIDAVEKRLETLYKPGDFGLVIVDSQYRMIPKGIDENSNNQITAIYNQLDSIADSHGCSFALVHHASKGNQSQKGITDVGAGAGAMTRATDTHLIIRDHAEPGLAVFDAVTRSSKQPESFSAKFEWPTWSLDASSPELKQQAGKGTANQAARDAEADRDVLEVLSKATKPVCRAWITNLSGIGDTRLKRSLFRMRDRLIMTTGPNPQRKSMQTEFYQIDPSATSAGD